jgi:hypothetical protein
MADLDIPQRHSHLRRRSATGPSNSRIGSRTAVRALGEDRAARWGSDPARTFGHSSRTTRRTR